jgi:[acyl-carrier-protein] S-malonyltransferase
MSNKLSMVFPGQGSQALNMMDGFTNNKLVREVFSQASDTLNIDFWEMLHADSSEVINQTVNTQPLLLTVGYATYQAWLDAGGKIPDYVAGHSLGEWTALVASGVLDFENALKLVKIRAEAMQDAVKPGYGAMSAVLGLDDDIIVDACKVIESETGLIVAGVNFNSVGQVVIAGDKSAVELVSQRLQVAGARKIIPLPVSVPSHCALMKPASVVVQDALLKVTFNQPRIPIIHNYSVKSYQDPELIKQALVKQLYMPVLWVDTIKYLASVGTLIIVECAPSKTLSSLNKRIDGQLQNFSLHDEDNIKHVTSILNS